MFVHGPKMVQRDSDTEEEEEEIDEERPGDILQVHSRARVLESQARPGRVRCLAKGLDGYVG